MPGQYRIRNQSICIQILDAVLLNIGGKSPFNRSCPLLIKGFSLVDVIKLAAI
jgi:hypothetical protein